MQLCHHFMWPIKMLNEFNMCVKLGHGWQLDSWHSSQSRLRWWYFWGEATRICGKNTSPFNGGHLFYLLVRFPIVWQDFQLLLENQVAARVKSHFYHFCIVRRMCMFLLEAVIVTVIPVFIISRLNYCTALNISWSLWRIQQPVWSVEDLTGIVIIRQVLQSLHWLPVELQVKFKELVLTSEHLCLRSYLHERPLLSLC